MAEEHLTGWDNTAARGKQYPNEVWQQVNGTHLSFCSDTQLWEFVFVRFSLLKTSMRNDLYRLFIAWAHTTWPYCVGFQQDQPRAGGMPPFPAFLFNFSVRTALLPGQAVPGQYLICKQTLQQAHLCCRLWAICSCSQPARGKTTAHSVIWNGELSQGRGW